MPEPGLYELRGDHGEGKTTSLECIARASGEKIDIPLRDGAAKGYLKLDGATLFSIGKVNRTTGKADVSLLSASPLADFIEPGVTDHAAAARIRIQAVLRLFDIPVTKQAILTLVQDDYGAFTYLDQQEGIDLLVARDIVNAADRVRRLIHQQKQHYLREVDLAQAEITANTVERPSLLVDTTLAEAEAAHVTVIRTLERLSGEASQRAARENERAGIVLGLRPDVEAAQAELANATNNLVIANNEIAELKGRLAIAQATATNCFNLEQHYAGEVESTRVAAERWDQNQKLLQSVITGATEADVQKAATAVDNAKTLLEAARSSDEYRRKLSAQDLAEMRKVEAERLAKHYEEIALAVTGKLGTLLAQAGLPNLTVEDEELVVIHPDGSTEAVHRLSYAEKLQLVIEPYLAKHPDSVIALPWEQYTCLKPSKRLELAQAAAEKGLYIVTEVPDEGAIRVRKVS